MFWLLKRLCFQIVSNKGNVNISFIVRHSLNDNVIYHVIKKKVTPLSSSTNHCTNPFTGTSSPPPNPLTETLKNHYINRKQQKSSQITAAERKRWIYSIFLVMTWPFLVTWHVTLSINRCLTIKANDVTFIAYNLKT